jgi:eukaryotic-like serine/threonine-protein kinase
VADNSRIQAILDDMLDLDRTPEEACADSPDLLTEVRTRWEQIQRVRLHLDECFPPDESTRREHTAPLREIELPKIDGYVVDGILGRGGMGVVFKARQLTLNRYVALKMLLSGSYAGPVERARFRREAEAVAALRHPNIVQIYDAGELAGRNFYTMEFIDGGSLAEKLAGAVLPTQEACEVVATLACAVQFAHKSGFIHRDLKPGNILLTRDGVPKIADFGLARSIEAGPEFTLSGARVGTPSYMAPEQAMGKASAIGPAVDVYALGAVLYEMLIGRPPFEGTSASEVERQVIAEEPVPPGRLNPKVPRDVETICLKCLAKNPSRRYASAQDLADDLQRFLAGEAIAARPERRVERLVRKIRRRPVLSVTLTAVVLLTIACVGGWTWVKMERTAREAATRELDRVNQERHDQEFAVRLDAIRLNRTAIFDGAFETSVNARINKAHADKAYEAAFREAGVAEVFEDPDEVAARVGASSIRGPLASAVDDWSTCAVDPRRREWLLQVAGHTDLDRTGLRQRLRDPAVWHDPVALSDLGKKAIADKRSTRLLVLIGERLRDAGADAIPYLTRVQEEHPEDFWANFVLADALWKKNAKEAIRYYQAALALRPKAAVVHNNLGRALVFDGRWDEAIGRFRQAIQEEPAFAHAHSNLGLALRAKKQNAEALFHLQEAVRLGPQHAQGHLNLGIMLKDLGRLDEAVAEFEHAIRLDPNHAMAHAGLGSILQVRGMVDDAIEQYQAARRIHPEHALYHVNLGGALFEKGNIEKAKECFETALRLDAKSAMANSGLGYVMSARGQFDAAVKYFEQAVHLDPHNVNAHLGLGTAVTKLGRPAQATDVYRKVIALDPANAKAYFNLGLQLAHEDRYGEAIEPLEQACRLNPKFADNHGLLGLALLKVGRFADAKASLQRCLEGLPRDDPRRPAFVKGDARCDRLLKLEERLPAILQGKEQPTSGADTLELAEVLRSRGQHLTASRLFVAAFDLEPELAEKPGSTSRFTAARCAVLAGKDTDDAERARWRGQALAWLQADLANYTRKSKSTTNPGQVRKALLTWQSDKDLSAVRDTKALAKLPNAERESWHKLWRDVEALLVSDPGKLFAQARTCVDRKEWDKAAECYDRLRYSNVADDSEFWFEYAAVQLLSDDRNQYRLTCKRILFDKSVRGYLVARACTLAPISADDHQLVSQRVAGELKTYESAFWALTEQAALHVRADAAKDAVPLCQKSLAANRQRGAEVVNWLWLALAQQQLGNADQARAYFAKADAWLDGFAARPSDGEATFGLHRHNWLEAHVLRREFAEKLPPRGMK